MQHLISSLLHLRCSESTCSWRREEQHEYFLVLASSIKRNLRFMIVTEGKLLSYNQAKYLSAGILPGKSSVSTIDARKARASYMPSNLDCPVKTQMAVVVGDGVASREYHGGLKSLVGRQSCRRRVFVQTDTGSVLGIELDRSDNANTVKKRMQMALNVPTEESALTFGDLVLKNDLSVVRNDAPLRLTRGLIQRSSSTPCLSPNADSQQQRDRSGPLEIIGGLSGCSKMKKLIKQAIEAIECGVDPIPVHGGLGGAYFFRNDRGESIAIVKPTDEEPFAPNNPKGFVGKVLGQPGLKSSVRVGETGVREVAAYLLDHGNFAKVPPTVLVKISHPIFHVNNEMTTNKSPIKKQSISKIASFQKFVIHNCDASDHGTSSFSIAAVHRIGILDVRILNTDRHAGNILVKRLEEDFGRYPQMSDAVELIPIDHGLCLPETLEDPFFEWLHWPQASLPFSEDELEYINRLDANKDADMLRTKLPMLRESSLRILILCTTFLKTAAAAGLCLAEIGEMMSREFLDVEEEVSELELICMQAKLQVDQQISNTCCELVTNFSEASPEKEHTKDQFQFDDMEYEEDFQSVADSLTFVEDDLNFGRMHDPQKSSRYNTLPKIPEVTGLSCLLSQSTFPGHYPERNDFQRHSALNGSYHGVVSKDISVNYPSSPRLLNGSTGMPFPYYCSSQKTTRGCPLSKLEEIPYLEGEDLQEELHESKQEIHVLKQQGPLHGQFISPRSICFPQQNQLCSSPKGVWKEHSGQVVSPLRTTQSDHEMGVVAPKSIKFSDMSEGDWILFNKFFQELLPEAIASRRSRTTSHMQRLGTSCQF